MVMLLVGRHLQAVANFQRHSADGSGSGVARETSSVVPACCFLFLRSRQLAVVLVWPRGISDILVGNFRTCMPSLCSGSFLLRFFSLSFFFISFFHFFFFRVGVEWVQSQGL